METKQKEEAIVLFERKYGTKPQNTDFSVIDIYKKQRVYLYGTSQEAIKAYMTSQNIIRWLMLYYLWPVLADVVLLFICLLKYNINIDMLPCRILIGFGVAWVVLFFVLWCIVIRDDKKSKDTVVWINY